MAILTSRRPPHSCPPNNRAQVSINDELCYATRSPDIDVPLSLFVGTTTSNYSSTFYTRDNCDPDMEWHFFVS